VNGIRACVSPVLRTSRRLGRATRTLRWAGRSGAYAAIVHHIGRRTGDAHHTPVVATPTSDGFVIALPLAVPRIGFPTSSLVGRRRSPTAPTRWNVRWSCRWSPPPSPSRTLSAARCGFSVSRAACACWRSTHRAGGPDSSHRTESGRWVHGDEPATACPVARSDGCARARRVGRRVLACVHRVRCRLGHRHTGGRTRHCGSRPRTPSL